MGWLLLAALFLLALCALCNCEAADNVPGLLPGWGYRPDTLRWLRWLPSAVPLHAASTHTPLKESPAAAAALLELKAGLQDPRGALRSWQPGGDPCNRRAPWAGVTCSGRGEVLVLNLASANLSGTLSPALGRLSTLQEL